MKRLNSIEAREIRKFGMTALVFFGCLGLAGFFFNKTAPMVLFGSLALIGLGFIFLPGPLAPVYSGWLKIAHFIGRVVTTLMLALAFYLVITPAGMLKRLFGGARPRPQRRVRPRSRRRPGLRRAAR